MKKAKKVVALALCAVMLVVGSVAGTMAYLTSQDAVTNTFTVGNVVITLDERNVDNDQVDGATPARDKSNDYKLIPSGEYVKDPTVHFAANSKASYLFVKVENGLVKTIDGKAVNIEAAASADYKTIAEQITTNGWAQLTGTNNIYFKQVPAAGATQVDYPVFAEFEIADNVDNDTLAKFAGAQINVTAYAVQADGFDGAAAAWAATFGKTTQTPETPEA